jgi:hypothetical protein
LKPILTAEMRQQKFIASEFKEAFESLKQRVGGDPIAADEPFDDRRIGRRLQKRFATRARRHGSLGREASWR